MLIFRDIEMSNLTTMRVGGKASLVVFCETIEELRETLLKYKDTEIFILGNGSNTIVKDQGFGGTIIRPSFDEMEVVRGYLRVQSGTSIQDLIAFARSHKKLGPEILTGIPGTVGGVIAMNAGFTKPVSTIIHSVVVMDYKGNLRTLTKEQMQFQYRSSIIQKEPLVIIEAHLEVTNGDNTLIVSQMLERRRKRQPIYYPSCGSIFKKASLRSFQGWREGNAVVRGTYIVNEGNATATEVLTLISRIKEVDSKLELEVGILG